MDFEMMIKEAEKIIEISRKEKGVATNLISYQKLKI